MYQTEPKLRKVTLLSALELLDEAVRKSAVSSNYVGSLTQLTVSDAIRRAKQAKKSNSIQPRHDQLQMTELTIV